MIQYPSMNSASLMCLSITLTLWFVTNTCPAQPLVMDSDEVVSQSKQLVETCRQMMIHHEIDKKSFDLLQAMLDPPVSDRTRLYIPLPPRARRAETPKVELPQQISQVLENIGLQLIKHSEQLAAQGNADQAYRKLFQAAAFDPQLKHPSRVLASTIESLYQRRILAPVPQPNSLTGWPARSYLQITTPHFKIVSQAPQKISDDLASFCEQTYCIWQQLYFDYWCDPAKFKGRLAGANTPLETPHEFNVVLFRDRDSYVKKLKSIEPNIGASTGYYSPKLKTAFFYWDGDKSSPTVAHELTHQFFQEAGLRPSNLDTESQTDFWIVEGIALYMESISKRYGVDSFVVDVGGWDSPRLQAARYRRLHDEFWIPWDEFHRATGKRFREGSEISLWYSHATGMTHFWMDGDATRRQSLMKYIVSVYQNQPAPKLLLESVNDERLRSDYDRFIMPSRSLIESRVASADRQDFVFSHIDVDSTTLLKWPSELRRCNWFDLSFTKIDDQLFLKSGDAPWDCVRLNVEGTAITDASLSALAEMPRLEELDLSHCAITDEGLKYLRGHKTLKTLWLTGTKITNEALAVIESLPKATMVDVQQTRITQQAWQDTLKKMPRLKKGN